MTGTAKLAAGGSIKDHSTMGTIDDQKVTTGEERTIRWTERPPQDIISSITIIPQPRNSLTKHTASPGSTFQ
jgi:hypothetical protein